MRYIAIVDYGVGNLKSVANAMAHLGHDTLVTGDPMELERADAVILPGVGAFPDAADRLRQAGLDKMLRGQAGRKPILGICLGMQLAVVEFARNVCGLTGAHSSELDPQTPYPVIDLMPDQVGVTAKGGTMRLGSCPCRLEPGSLAAAVYGAKEINERHRHRYEFNSDYLEQFEAAGMQAVGVNPDTNLVEVVEVANHPWFVGTQYHPEYKSTVQSPSPLFVAFVNAALACDARKK